MIACDDAVLEQWHPDFSSSSQRNPSWTRATCSGVLLCNSLEWVRWLDNPVQVVLCDACGYDGCASGGYIHISRLGNHLLWTRPQINESDAWERDQYQAAWPLRRFGAVILTLATWTQWREFVPDLPEPNELPLATGREMLDAWLLGARGQRRVASSSELISALRGQVLASDSFAADVAINRVESVLAELSGLEARSAPGRLARATDVGAQVEVLYFDGPAEEDWAALALIGSRVIPAFSREWVFVPEG